MTTEELARYIAENWGREAVMGRGCWERLELALESRDMPHADADIQRLDDMITNLLDEAWGEHPEASDDVRILVTVGRMYLEALDSDPENEMLTLPEAMLVTQVREAVRRNS